ncbi:MAG TPA: CoA pyrophosphatase [Bacteroidia bacterium]|nr:CoA pyrophosphatase [Bacteroidia bacterium]
MKYMFQSFIKKLSEEIKTELPGFSAHNLMAHLGRDVLAKYSSNDKIPKKSAVLILLFPDKSGHFVRTSFILRSVIERGSHGGQVAFPGGGMELTDADLGYTALRETEEEIGVKKDSISLIGMLTPVYIPVSNYMVHPYIGVVDSEPEFILDPQEVAGIITCSLNDLIHPENKTKITKYVKIVDCELEIPCYKIEGKVIWGATAMIISELEQLLLRVK